MVRRFTNWYTMREMEKNKIFLSVVISSYNEIENLRRGVLDEMRDFLVNQDYHWEVIISDDGSTDEGPEFVEKYAQKNKGFRLLRNPHAGKPFGLRAGIQMAKGKYLLLTDMDQSVSLSEVKKLLPYFEKNFDIVIGSRGAVRKGAPWYRKLIAIGFMVIRRAIILSGIVDTQCGFKAFKKEAVKKIFKRLQIFQEEKKAVGWRVTAFDVELLFIAQKKRYKIAEVPVKWIDRDVARGKKHNFLKESYEMASEILRARLNDLRGLYEK